MSEIVLSHKYKPLLQRPYITDENNPLYHVDTFVCTGGRFSAKSFSTAVAVGTWSRDFNFKTLYSRYTMTSAKDSIIPEFTDNLELLNTRHEFSTSQDRVKHYLGSEIVFKGIKTGSGNQTANLKSLKGFNVFVMDEVEEMPNKKDYQKIQLSIRSKDKPNIYVMMLNPTTKEHWVFEEYFEKRGVPEGFNGIKDNVCYIHTSYLDCIEHVPKNILAEFERLKETNMKEYNHIVLGGWLDKREGVIFEHYEIGDFNRSLPYIFGLDFGSKDPDALVRVAIDKRNNTLYLKEELYQNGLSTDDLKRKVKSITGQKLIIADSQGKRTIQDLSSVCNIRKCSKGQGSVVEGIKTMKNYKIVVDPSSSNLMTELNNYIWSDRKGEVPEDDYNHLIDAGRYGVTYLSKPSRSVYAPISK